MCTGSALVSRFPVFGVVDRTTTRAGKTVDLNDLPMCTGPVPVLAFRPVNLNVLHNAPFFQNGLQAKSGFEMCFGPSTWVLGPKHVSNPE